MPCNYKHLLKITLWLHLYSLPVREVQQGTILLSSHPTVAASVLEFAGEGEEGGKGGDGNVEHQLQRVPQANQIEVAQDDCRPQGRGFVLLQSRVEEIQMALWTRARG